MTRLLEQAVAKARSLPEDQQDAIGRLMLNEIEVKHAAGPASTPPFIVRDGIPVFQVPPGTRQLTSEDVARALDDEV